MGERLTKLARKEDLPASLGSEVALKARDDALRVCMPIPMYEDHIEGFSAV